MTKIKIGTLNCQNNEDNRLDRNNHASILADHILNEQYDILGLQELTISYTKKINSYLENVNDDEVSELLSYISEKYKEHYQNIIDCLNIGGSNE